MNDTVNGAHPENPILAKPATAVPAVVNLAREFLAACEKGEIRAFGVAYIIDETTGAVASRSAGCTSLLIGNLMVSAIQQLDHSFKHALRGE